MPMNPYHKALYAKDKGRRVIHDNANYKSWDFLKQNTIESPHTVGKTSPGQTKFGSGFYRRRDIVNNAQRLEYLAQKEERDYYGSFRRHTKLSNIHTRNGNILTNDGTPDEPTRARRTFAARDKFFSAENAIRQKVGAGRFHRVPDEKEIKISKSRRDAEFSRQKQSSSLLGFGRPDIESYGVHDNFIGHGNVRLNNPSYLRDPAQKAAKHLISKDIIRHHSYPPTPNSAAAQGRRKSEVRSSATAAHTEAPAINVVDVDVPATDEDNTAARSSRGNVGLIRSASHSRVGTSNSSKTGTGRSRNAPPNATRSSRRQTPGGRSVHEAKTKQRLLEREFQEEMIRATKATNIVDQDLPSDGTEGDYNIINNIPYAYTSDNYDAGNIRNNSADISGSRGSIRGKGSSRRSSRSVSRTATLAQTPSQAHIPPQAQTQAQTQAQSRSLSQRPSRSQTRAPALTPALQPQSLASRLQTPSSSSSSSSSQARASSRRASADLIATPARPLSSQDNDASTVADQYSAAAAQYTDVQPPSSAFSQPPLPREQEYAHASDNDRENISQLANDPLYDTASSGIPDSRQFQQQQGLQYHHQTPKQFSMPHTPNVYVHTQPRAILRTPTPMPKPFISTSSKAAAQPHTQTRTRTRTPTPYTPYNAAATPVVHVQTPMTMHTPYQQYHDVSVDVPPPQTLATHSRGGVSTSGSRLGTGRSLASRRSQLSGGRMTL